jgi:hydrogenase-4 membrane subunit HyfE
MCRKYMATTIQIIMTVVLFLAGVVMLISGLLIIMTREYQEAMRTLSNQSTRLSGKAIGDIGVQAAVEGASQLLDSITRLIQTAMGTGAFLCLLGTLICGISFWMLSLVHGS